MNKNDARIVERGICEYCDVEHGWTKSIERVIAERFPDGTSSDIHSACEQAMYALFEQPVADFSYDDNRCLICAKHLRAIADLLNGEPGVSIGRGY